MKFSRPIYILKQQAKKLSRREKIPLHQALDRIARREGFGVWSLLAARATEDQTTSVLYSQLSPGDLVLQGGRPGQGKTLLGLELVIESMSRGNVSAFFTLEFTEADLTRCFDILDRDFASFRVNLILDSSDRISAAHIIRQLASAPASTLALVDYLQLLDQKRDNARLMDQVAALKRFAQARQLIVVCLSQIDRRYDPELKPYPDLTDVRMPNPVDLRLFDKACFLNRGTMQVAALS